MTPMVLLCTYALVLSVVFVYGQFRRRGSQDIAALRESLNGPNVTQEDRTKYLCELARLSVTAIPWYERSLSTVGIVAFIAMLVTTGVQTISSEYAKRRLSDVEEEVKQMEAAVKSAHDVVASISHSVLDIYKNTMSISKDNMKALECRLAYLRKRESLDKAGLSEMYEIALLLSDWDTARDCLERCMSLFDETVVADKIAMAEYYYLSGSNSQAQSIIGEVSKDSSRVSSYWKLRMAALDALLDPGFETKRDSYARNVSLMCRISYEQAEVRLKRQMDLLRNAKGDPSIAGRVPNDDRRQKR